jgi:hypothetical protein
MIEFNLQSSLEYEEFDVVSNQFIDKIKIFFMLMKNFSIINYILQAMILILQLEKLLK